MTLCDLAKAMVAAGRKRRDAELEIAHALNGGIIHLDRDFQVQLGPEPNRTSTKESSR